MRITLQLLWKYSQKPLGEVELLDLSGNKISAIEQLDHCPNLQSLVLSNNRVCVLQNLNCCHQLWSIDLTGNRLKSLQGLSLFPVLGSLKLSYNELEWSELPRLSHMTLLSLSLSGNPQLDSDPHYREHVLDILPHLWVLDERIITASERKEVSQFFSRSETSLQPVWRKTTDRVFFPTFMKDLLVTGVFGAKTTRLMAHFPVTYTHTTEMDKRRLCYLAYTAEEEMKLHLRYMRLGSVAVPELGQMVKGRDEDTEQCNMFLLLLLAHMEYGIPHDILMATLDTAKLMKIGGVNCVSVFDLPSHMMLGVASLLLSAAAIDRQDKKGGGMYDKLFKSLNCVLESQQRKTAAVTAGRPTQMMRRGQQLREEEAHLQCLLASEVVQLLCLVPLFLRELTTHQGLLRLVSVATSNPHVGDVIRNLTWKVQAKGGSEWDVYDDVMDFLLQSTSDNVQVKSRRGFPLRHHRRAHFGVRRTTSQLLPRPQSSSHQRRSHSASHSSPKHTPHSTHPHSSHPHSTHSHSSPTRHPSASHLKQLELGDLVLLGSEKMARIVSLPERGVVVLQMMSSSQLSLTIAPHSYLYTETEGLTWNRHRGYWTKENISASLSEIQLPSLPIEAAPVSRTTTPDPIRPHSGMSMASEVETIPSESESDDKSESHVDQPPMRVDISDSRPPSRAQATEEAKTEHQKKVMMKLNRNQLQRDDYQTNPAPSPETSPSTSPVPPTLELKIPSPQIHLLDKWECAKSLASSSGHQATKHHSCQERPLLLPPPHPSPISRTPPLHLPPPRPSPISRTPPLHPPPPHPSPTSPTPPLLPHSVSTIAFTTAGRGSEGVHTTPHRIVRQAWSPTRSHPHPKHNQLTTTRIMNRRDVDCPHTIAGHSKQRATSAPSGPLRSNGVVGGGGTTTIILQPRIAKVSQFPPRHMSAYTASAVRATAKHRFNSARPCYKAPPTTRQLGDMRSLFIGGTSIT